jgi:hypothetical protein
MPGARCTRSLAWKLKNHTSIVTTVTPVSPGIPRAIGFNGFLRSLPGDRALLPPSSPRSLLLENLIPASGYQDATTSPSANTRTRLMRAPRPSHPASRFVTIAHTPLLSRRDGARNAADLQVRSTATDWHDGQISCSHENAVKEIFLVIARKRRSNPVCFHIRAVITGQKRQRRFCPRMTMQ